MKKRLVLSLVLLMLSVSVSGYTFGCKLPSPDNSLDAPTKLLVVWTSGDREVALKMVFMYTFNAKKRGWWEETRLLIWGPSAKLLSGDKELQDGIKQMKEAGVELVACKACADLYGFSEKLESLGVEVKYMGVPLTEMLKSDWTAITF
jgi:hypothetical protein